MTGASRLTVLIMGLAAGTLAGLAPASAAARPVRACSGQASVTVIVDFRHWGGPLLRACGTTPTTGFALLNQGGWRTSGTQHDGPGFVCRIGYAGFRHGTQYPTPAQDPCVNTPPASAYWTYWLAGPGQDTWRYSQSGALTLRPAPGSVGLWEFGGTNLAGTSGSAVPAVTPASVRVRAARTAPARARPVIVDAPPVAVPVRGGRGSAVPTVITLVIVAALAGTGTAAARRRTRRERSAA
ncbi:MAG TPA: hypothetical protein VFQ44_15380 [Streptosporangiaceae bacterium]|nr:hypothetical protein [Streptosporangiaceae bacterium]